MHIHPTTLCLPPLGSYLSSWDITAVISCFASDPAKALNMVRVLGGSILKHQVGWEWGFLGMLDVDRRKITASLGTEIIIHYVPPSTARPLQHCRSGAEGKHWGISINWLSFPTLSVVCNGTHGGGIIKTNKQKSLLLDVLLSASNYYPNCFLSF